MSTVSTPPGAVTTKAPADDSRGPGLRRRKKGGWTPKRVLLYAFVILMALGWLFPVVWAVYNSFRDYSFTAVNGYLSFGGFTLENYANAWQRGNFGQTFLNSLIITVPSVLFTLLLASMAAFVLARFSFKFNLAMLVFFTAANLLPPQALLIPLFRFYVNVDLYDTYWAVILTHVAFQTGFVTFVLSNYMKALPKDLSEAAYVDGASAFRQYWQIIMPLCLPALAALGTLQVTWVYNDLFWAVGFMSSGDKFPITSSLANLSGQFFTDYNLLSAGSVIVAIPTLVVFFALQRYFVAGLTLGASKG